jgi:hypothetical protein
MPWLKGLSRGGRHGRGKIQLSCFGQQLEEEQLLVVINIREAIA